MGSDRKKLAKLKREAEAGRRKVDADPPGRHWRVLSQPRRNSPKTAEDCAFVSIENQGDFDELVVGTWFHIEQMDTRHWWMRVGEATFGIDIPKGKPVRITHIESKLHGKDVS